MIKYIKSILWRVAKCLSYIEEEQCLKVNMKCYQYKYGSTLEPIAKPVHATEFILNNYQCYVKCHNMSPVFSHREYCNIYFVYRFCDGNAHVAVKEYKKNLPCRRIPSMTYFHTLNRQCMKPILFQASLVISERAVHLTQT